MEKGISILIQKKNLNINQKNYKGNLLLTKTKFSNISEIDKQNPFPDLLNKFVNSKKEDAYLKKLNNYNWVLGSGFDSNKLNKKVLDKNKSSILGTIQDITESKLLEIEKHQKDELLYQQSKMAAMGEILGNIAHQWRQPLSTISTAATGTKL